MAKKICLTVNFLFYSKNQLFQTSSIAQIFKNQEFCHSGLSQPKNFRVRTPLSSNNEKKILQSFTLEDSNPRPYWAAICALYALPTVPSRPYKGKSRYLIKWILKMFVSKLESWFGAIHKWYPMTGLFFWPTYNWFCFHSCNEFYFTMSDFDNTTSINHLFCLTQSRFLRQTYRPRSKWPTVNFFGLN